MTPIYDNYLVLRDIDLILAIIWIKLWKLELSVVNSEFSYSKIKTRSNKLLMGPMSPIGLDKWEFSVKRA